MTITPEEIAAFADGELSPERRAEVAAAIAADPQLADQVEQHRRLKAMLTGHYAPIAEEPVPDRLAAMLQAPKQADVVDFAAARERREQVRQAPRWGWLAGAALAASLALAVFLPGGSATSPYAEGQLATALDSQLVAEQPQGVETRILLSFRNQSGQYCRAFSGEAGGGVACRDQAGWKLEATGEGRGGDSSDYRMAGAEDADILALVQDMAAGPALDADGEAEAREKGWR